MMGHTIRCLMHSHLFINKWVLKMGKFKNLAILLGIILKKMPLLTLFIFFSPLLSGFLTVFIYTSQVDLINVIADHIGNVTIKDVLLVALTPLTVFLVVNILQALTNLVGSIFTNKLNAMISWEFQNELIDLSNGMPYIQYNDPDFNNKLERAKSVVGDDLVNIINNLVSLFNKASAMLSLIILLLTNKLYLVSVIVFLMIAVNLAIKLSTEIRVRKIGRQLTFDGRVADYLNGVINQTSFIREIRMYNCSDYFMNKWGEKTTYQNRKRYGARKLEIKIGIVVSTIQTTAIFVILFMLIFQMQMSSQISIGLLSVLFLNLVQCKNRIMDMLWPICGLYLSSVKLYDFNVVMCRKQELDGQGKAQGDGAAVPFVAEHIGFAYSKESTSVLDDLSLTIQKGEKIAIVGPNGAGKSTLIKLILGLYSPDQGQVLWNNSPIVSKDIAIVFQNYIHYELTLRENVGLGNVDKMNQDQEIMDVLKKCGLEDLVRKLGGLDTPVGFVQEGGGDLSGGQWQRLAIARALFRDSEFLIFDEPTSAIDPRTEVQIYQMLMEICREKTAIFVSHRLGWAKNSDRILVLDKKHIAEEGTHAELISQNRIYSTMFKLQASWYIEDRSVEQS